MSATAAVNTKEAFNSIFSDVPVAAATRIFVGSLVAIDAAGNAVPASDTAGLTVQGRCEGLTRTEGDNLIGSDADNRNGLAGDLTINIKRGVFKYANSITNPITAVQVGSWAYVEDDQTVNKDGGGNMIRAGLVREVVADGVWVDTSINLSAFTAVADNTVTAAKLTANAVTTAKILDANVTTAKIADANVTVAKLADEVAGLADGLGTLRVARATFNPSATAGQRTVAAHGLGVIIPDKSIVVGGFVEVETALDSGDHSGSVAISVEGANDIVAAAPINGAPYSTTGRKAIVPKANTPEATSIKLTAAREITATVTTTALTAGKLTVFLYYVQGA